MKVVAMGEKNREIKQSNSQHGKNCEKKECSEKKIVNNAVRTSGTKDATSKTGKATPNQKEDPINNSNGSSKSKENEDYTIEYGVFRFRTYENMDNYVNAAKEFKKAYDIEPDNEVYKEAIYEYE